MLENRSGVRNAEHANATLENCGRDGGGGRKLFYCILIKIFSPQTSSPFIAGEPHGSNLNEVPPPNKLRQLWVVVVYKICCPPFQILIKFRTSTFFFRHTAFVLSTRRTSKSLSKRVDSFGVVVCLIQTRCGERT